MQKPGMRKVCPHCGSTELIHDTTGRGGHCKNCRKRSDAFLDMHFAHIPGFKREIAAREKVKKLSWYQCDEIHALWFLITVIVLLLVFICLS